MTATCGQRAFDEQGTFRCNLQRGHDGEHYHRRGPMSFDIAESMRKYPDFYLDYRELGDGRAVWIQRKMFTHAITIGVHGSGEYLTHWCYSTRKQAETALAEWDPFTEPEPSGWFRHPDTGRRRPNGDASREHIQL